MNMVIAVVLPKRFICIGAEAERSSAKCTSIFNQVSCECVGNIQNTQTSLSCHCFYRWEQICLHLNEQIQCSGIWDRTASLFMHQETSESDKKSLYH